MYFSPSLELHMTLKVALTVVMLQCSKNHILFTVALLVFFDVFILICFNISGWFQGYGSHAFEVLIEYYCWEVQNIELNWTHLWLKRGSSSFGLEFFHCLNSRVVGSDLRSYESKQWILHPAFVSSSFLKGFCALDGKLQRRWNQEALSWGHLPGP